MVAARTVRVSMVHLFGCGGPHRDDFNAEVKGYPGKRMVCIDGDVFRIHGCDGHNGNPVLGRGLELHANLDILRGLKA